MSAREFLVVWACCLATMLMCRCLPVFVLRGRALPERVERTLELIPCAAFAALVANDLFSADMFAGGVVAATLPFAASAVVVVVALVSRSLVWSTIAGIVSYAVLLFATGLL